jgi:YHS domain-containing protein
MMRGLLFFLAIFVVYLAIKTVVRSAVRSYHDDDEQRRSRRVIGDEMVLDPECRTYVVKDRAIARRIRGSLTYFCSEACARQYEEKNRA